ncbi:MAG: hypothetical protein IAF38_05040, partial [Bacteroidia bacterium]|nr:hypothetical protein [Bacteroidia bacterium]
MVLLCINILILCGISFLLFKKFARGNNKIIFPIAFSVRILAGISFAWVYIYIFESEGDTFDYFERAGNLAWIFKNDFWTFFERFISSNTNPSPEYQFSYFNGGALVFIKLLSLLHLVTGGNYWICTICFSVFSFYCSWKLFLALCNFNSKLRFPALIAFHFIPMVLFWNSGCLRGSLINSFLCLSVYFTLEIVRFNATKKTLISMALLAFSLAFL